MILTKSAVFKELNISLKSYELLEKRYRYGAADIHGAAK